MATATKEKTDTVEKVEGSEAEKAEEARTFSEQLHKVVLAAVGAVRMARDEVDSLVTKLVEKGQLAEKDAKHLFEKIWKKEEADEAEAGKGKKKKASESEDEPTTSSFEQALERILRSMHIPTKKDVDALSEKISSLAKKIEEFVGKGKK